MFVNKQQAKERLSSKDNILRKKDSCYDGSEVEIFEKPVKPAATPEVLPAVDPPSQHDQLIDEAMGPMPDLLNKLDSLLHPHASNYGRFRMQRENQQGVGETAVIMGEHAAGRVLQLSPDQARAYSLGKAHNNTGSEIPELKRRMEQSKERIAEKAASRLDATLEALSPAKLSAVDKATDLARIGKDMAVILEKVSPKEGEKGEGVHFHIFRPEFQQINNYEVVQLGGTVPIERDPV